MAAQPEMLVLELPTSGMLRMAACPHQSEAVGDMLHGYRIAGWRNTYTRECNGMGVGHLLGSPEGVRFIEKVWGWHRASGTPLMVRQQNVRAGLEPVMLPNTARIELLQNTAQIVFAVMRFIDVLPPLPVTLDKELDDGVYIYLIEVADSPVFKLGTVTICHKIHATTGRPCGRRCIAHRYFLGGREMPPPGRHLTGVWSKDRLSLRHHLEGSAAEEGEIHAELRKLADELGFLQGNRGEEFHDNRLIPTAIRMMNQLVAKRAAIVAANDADRLHRADLFSSLRDAIDTFSGLHTALVEADDPERRQRRRIQ